MEEREAAIPGEFGIRTPPLLDYLQGILRGYSDGQILKELLQNAEDAGASEIRFLYDENNYGTESLLQECLADFQGPALCSYNNAVFKPQDWKGIQKPAQSCKKNDVLKVGRFGIGFNSVYHLTDLPCIISQNVLAMIDPFEKYFSFGGRPSSGHSWDLGLIFKDKKDQLKPFEEAFPVDVKFEEQGHVTGTFFRFPLRKEPNRLSQSVFSIEKIHDLLEAFKEDAKIVLLFLRNIKRAAIYWKEELSQTSECFLEVSFSSSCNEQIRQDRQRFITALQNFKDNPDCSDNIEITNTFDIVTKCGDFETKHTNYCKEKWVVSQEIAIECSPELETLYRKLNFLPWVGVAVPVFNFKETLKGRTFCFLPLPPGEDSLSGLPVHVHGFFGISDDRRSLKWPGGDQIQNEDAEWNKLLVNEVLPRVYRKALLKAIDVTLEQNDLDPNIVYKAMPNINQELSLWREAVDTLFSSLFHDKVLYCHDQKAWMSVKEVIIMTQDLPVTSETARVIVKCLQNSGLHVIEDLPGHVRDAISKFASDTHYVSYNLVVKCLKQQSVNEYSDEERLYLLNYLLEKLPEPEDMDGLELLPTNAGHFATFKRHPDTSEVVYMETNTCSHNLLPGMCHRFVKHLEEEHLSKLNEALKMMASSEKWKQLKHLDVDDVIQLLPETLPPSWNQECEDYEKWIPSMGDQPDLQWLQLFWQFVCREAIDLLKLEGLKILPVSEITKEPIKMMALKKNSRIINVCNADKTIINFAEIKAVLTKVGVTVCELPEFVSKHHQILSSSFVHSFHQDDVLKALKATGASNIEYACSSSVDTQGKLYSHLLPYLSGARFSDQDRCFLRGLSIFRTFQNRKAEAENLTSIDSGVSILKEEDFQRLPQIHFHKKYILVGTNELLLLFEKLCVNLQPFEDALMKILRDVQQGLYPDNEIRVLFEWVRDHFDEITSIVGVGDLLKETSFVPNGREELRKPKNLYDISNEFVKWLVHDNEVLLSEKVSSSWLDMLNKLGLQKEEIITAHHLINAAMNISSQNDVSKASVLVEYLCKYPQCLQNTHLSSTLKEIPFISCTYIRPPFYPKELPLFGKQEILYKPSDLVVYSKKTCYLAGASAPMVDSISDKKVLDQLCVRNKPTVGEVLQQLHHNCFHWNNSSSQTEMVHHIYEFLNDKIVEKKEEILKGLPEKWILVDDQFVNVKSVYKEEGRGAIDLRPFLCILPRKYKQYDDLLQVAGVPDQVDSNASFLVDVLEKIKTMVDTSDNNKSIDMEACLRVSTNILRRLVEFENEIENEDIKCKLYVPTTCIPMKLLPPDQVCFDDTSYDNDEGDDFCLDEDEPPIYLVHNEVLSHIAKKLGVISLTKRLAGADEIGGIKQTGQFEPLTLRLKNILRDGYQPESIPKEMVQNAEDAGASEVKFLLDLRTNRNAVKKLLDPAMEAIHGPALWVYNDAEFTEEDLQNITKLGGATKSEDRTKIGQFGLGFNAVYHITDVPSFVTGNFITFFDPHKSHLQRHIRGEGSGIQLNFTSNPSRMRRFRDQFLPYEDIFGCTILGDEGGPKTYNSTLFRLPLRTETEAWKSKISNESYNEERMKSLLTSLCQNACQMLLFTENVKSISVYVLSEAEGEPSLLYKLLKSTTEKEPVANSFRKAVYSSVNGQNEICSPSDTTSAVMFESKWSEKGKQYLQLNDVQLVTREKWVVTMSAGRGRTFQICLEDIGMKSGLLPCGGVAWNANANTGGGLFCFLPLSVPQSGLPVCINGSFAVSADRRSLWREPESGTISPTAAFKTRWNQSLFEDVIVSAYITLLQQTMVAKYVKMYGDLYILWPNPLQTSKNSDYGAVMTGFYKAIICGVNGKTPPTIFMKKDGMYSIDDVVFTVDEIQNDNKMFPIVERVIKNIASKEIMKMPMWVRTGFEEAGYSSTVMKMTYSWERFFKEVFLPNLNCVQDEDILSLVSHALSERDDTVLDLMRVSECIPTKISNGRKYKKPSNLLDPNRFKDIFFEDEGVFPEDQFLGALNMHQKGTLKDIGCLKDDINWKDVLERTMTIQCVWQTNTGSARRRVKALLNFMDHKLEVAGNGHQNIENDLREVAFLPAVRDGDVNLQCPNKVYLARELDLVGFVCYILDTSNTDCTLSLSVPVKRLLGMQEKKVKPAAVIKNLSHLKLILEKGTVPDNLESQCNSMYSFLQTHVGEVEVQHFLQQEEWFLVDQGFIAAGKLSFCGESIPPYLHKIPKHFGTRFEMLLRTAGAKDYFNYDDFMGTLDKIEKSQQGEPLGAQMVSSILTKVIKPLFDIIDDMPFERISQILLPDTQNVLQSSNTLCFCDLDSFQHLIGEYNLCHKEIPLPWAKKLGVRDIREQMLKKYSHSLPGFGGAGERFGQREELVTRITRIMEGYPCDFTILKELVQNADDAKATKVHFVLDNRMHPTQNLFYNSMSDLQGPALLAFNNRPFTDNDITGIQKLGVGGKADDTDKTGRYGVGFNVVYHLTDCPMFLSGGNTLCIFDPTLQYVADADEVCPGRMFRPIDEKMLATYSDIFNCFFSFGNDFQLHEGTLFRFPLRQKKSKISDQISPSTIVKLFTDFKEEMFDVLLFLKNVTEISFSTCTNGKLENTYRVKADLSLQHSNARTSFFQTMSEMKDKSLLEIPVSDVQYQATIVDNHGRRQEWLVHQRLGVENKGRVPHSVKSVNSVRKLLPKGGVAARCFALEENASPDESMFHGKAYCFLPLPIKTNLPVHVDGYFALGHEARRNLWEEPPGDPKSDWNRLIAKEIIGPAYVHIIEWMKTFYDRFADTRVNIDNMREKLHDYHKLFPLHYRSSVVNIRDFWEEISQSFYTSVIMNKHMFFPVVQPTHQRKGGRQHSTKKSKQSEFSLMWKTCISQVGREGFFDDLHQQIQENQGGEEEAPQHIQLRLLLSELGFPLLESPLKLYEIMKSILGTLKGGGVTLLKVNPKCVECFLKTTATKTTLQGLPMKLGLTQIISRDRLKLLIQYVTKNRNIELNGLPLLLTNEDVLREFNVQRKVFHSSYYTLVKKYSEQFLHHQFLSMLDRRDECFAEFEMSDLVHLLPSHLPRDKFCTGEYTVWYRDSRTKLFTPTFDWIKNLWKFLYEKGRNNNSALVQHFEHWSILPANDGKQKYLVPMKLANTVLSSHFSNYHEGLSHILRNLHAPVLESLDWTDQFITQFASSLDDGKNVLHIFKRLVKVNLDGFKVLRSEDHECILKFFSNFSKLNIHYFDRESLTVLKSLPCHETIYGEYIALADKKIYSVSMTNVPKNNQDTWVSKSGGLFVKKKLHLSDLYEVLGIEDISDCELYSRFILPCYKDLSSGAQWEHLTRIMVMVHSGPNPEGVVAVLNLKNIPLIPLEEGGLDYARCFHDWENPVFKEMSEKKYFPPKHPKQKDQTPWRKFLRLIGMQTDVNCEQFLQFAKNVSLEPKYSKREKILVEYLLNSHHLHEDRPFLSSVAKLAFISAAKVKGELSELHKQCTTSKVTLSAVSVEHQKLVWSQEPLLPNWVHFTRCAQCGYHLEQTLSKSKEPTLKQVLQHTQILCTSLANFDAILPKNKKHPAVQHEKLLNQIIKDILQFLSEKCEKAKSSDPCEDKGTCCGTCKEIVSALEDVAVVPLKGRKLFKAKRLTKNLPQEDERNLFLFLGELPEEFMSYSKLLYCLGTTKQPSLLQYADTLKLLEIQSREDQLKSNPNFIPAAEQAEQGFFRCLSEEKEAKLNDIDKLFLISINTEKLLIESTKLYYNDKPSYASRLNDFPCPVLKVINEGSDPTSCLSLEKIVAKMEHLKPQLISQNVEEIESANNVSSYNSNCPCSYSEKLRKVFSWHTFPRALKILLANEGVSDFTDSHMEIFQTKYAVICLDEILTELRMKDGAVIPSSQKDVGVLFKRKSNCEVNILLSHNPNKTLLEHQIAQGFSQMFNNFLKNTERLQVVFKSESEDMVISNLMDIGLETAESDMEGMIKKPVLGSTIEEDIVCLLIQDPFSQYLPNEYVAYNNAHDTREHFVYAKIIKKKESESATTRSSDSSDFIVTYIIDVGEKEPKEVETIWLYKFPSCKDDSSFPEDADHSVPQAPSSSCTDVVEHEKRQSYQDSEEFNDLGKTKREVTKIMEEAWKQIDSVKRTILRRLMRKWHPDKHTEKHAHFAEEIFKHIQREITRLENGIPSGVDSSDDVARWARQNTSQQRRYWGYWKRFGTDRHERSGGWHGRRHQSSYDNFGNSSQGWGYSHFYTPPSFHKTNLEACRWLRQAHVDLDLAAKVVKQTVSFYQWKSSLCFFAVEKSVTAVQLFCGCIVNDEQGIMDAAIQIRQHLDVTQLIQQLVQIVKKNSHYPNSCPHPRIPHEVFSKEHADKAMKIAISVIEKVDKYINNA